MHDIPDGGIPARAKTCDTFELKEVFVGTYRFAVFELPYRVVERFAGHCLRAVAGAAAVAAIVSVPMML